MPELYQNDVNGYSFEPLDTKGLINLMCKISSGTLDLEKMGRESKRIISNYSAERWGETIEDICRKLILSRNAD